MINAVLVFLLVLCRFCSSSDPAKYGTPTHNISECSNSDVRLVGSEYPWEGNVQVCAEGQWGYVCHDSWDFNDARIVCGQLGYDNTGIYAVSMHMCLDNSVHFRSRGTLLFTLWYGK